MAISDDFTIDYVNLRVVHSSGTDIYTVNELYSYLQNTFDELDQMDDPIPMSAQTPTEYTFINGWYMNDDSFKYLRLGAIQTSGWLHPTNTTGVRILQLHASTNWINFVAGDIGKILTGGTTGDTGKVLAYDNTLKKVWVRAIAADDLFDDADENVSTVADGGTGTGHTTAVSTSGENLWANIYTLGTIEEDLSESEEQQIYIEQDGSRIFSGTEWWPEGAGDATTRHIDVLIKVKEASTEINGAEITVFLRHYPTVPTELNPADLYDHFGIDLTAGGRNAVPLATANDLNNTSTQAVVAGYNDIKIGFVNGTISVSSISGTFTNLETLTQTTSGATAVFIKQSATTGSGTLTLGNIVGTFDDSHVITGSSSSETATSTSTVTEAYTTTKNFTQGSSYNYSVIVDCSTRTLAEVYEYFKYITRVGSTYTMYPTATAQGGAITSTTKEGQLYIRAHEDNQTSPTNTFSPVKASPFGTFAGGTYFGAQGVWIENMASADVQSFQLLDSDGSTRTPPNFQSVTISNLISGDRVSVFRTSSGSTINKTMYTAAADNTTDSTTFVVNETISVDTPSLGTIRVVDSSDTGATRETRYDYSEWSGSTFTLSSGSLGRAFEQTTDTAYVPFIDLSVSATTATTTVIYTTDRTLLVRVRRKEATAILPFETTGTFSSTGYSTSAIRTTDSIVT